MDGRGGAVDSSADENNVYRPLYRYILVHAKSVSRLKAFFFLYLIHIHRVILLLEHNIIFLGNAFLNIFFKFNFKNIIIILYTIVTIYFSNIVKNYNFYVFES